MVSSNFERDAKRYRQEFNNSEERRRIADANEQSKSDRGRAALLDVFADAKQLAEIARGKGIRPDVTFGPGTWSWRGKERYFDIYEGWVLHQGTPGVRPMGKDDAGSVAMPGLALLSQGAIVSYWYAGHKDRFSHGNPNVIFSDQMTEAELRRSNYYTKFPTEDPRQRVADSLRGCLIRFAAINGLV
jgi:hypothetical protein